MWISRVFAVAIAVTLMTTSPAGAQNVGGVAGTAVPGQPAAPPRPVTPPRDRQPNAPPTPAGTAAISGRVLSAEGAPLRRTQVMLLGMGAGGRGALTDSEGRYSFSGLGAGRYTIRVSRSGYISLSYGQRAPSEPVKPMEVTDGQSLAGVDIVLPRGSVITGRVTDEFGEPMLQAQVQALRYQYQPSGERVLQPAGGISGMTDDLGQFRIYGLNPGEYVISAMARNQFMNTIPPNTRIVADGITFGPEDPAAEGY